MTLDKDFIGYGLHDAVLERIGIDWRGATVTITLSAVTPINQQVVIQATGLIEFVSTRRHPWGRGDNVLYVNDVRLVSAEENTAKKLELELSSGDVLALTAHTIERLETSELLSLLT